MTPSAKRQSMQPGSAAKAVRDDLPAKGRKLLALIDKRIHAKGFTPGSPETYLGYLECCEALGLVTPGMDVPWGRCSLVT